MFKRYIIKEEIKFDNLVLEKEDVIYINLLEAMSTEEVDEYIKNIMSSSPYELKREYDIKDDDINGWIDKEAMIDSIFDGKQEDAEKDLIEEYYQYHRY